MATREYSRNLEDAPSGEANRLGRLNRLLRDWQLGEQLPTTVDGVETAMVLVLVGLWALNIVQLAMASRTAIGRSSNPPLEAGLEILVVLRVVAWVAVVVRAKTVAVTWAIFMDVLCGVTILFLQSSLVSPAGYHSWEAWAYAMTVPCAFWAGIGLQRMWHSVIAGLVCAAAYLIAILPGGATSGDPVTPLTNSSAYLAFAVLGHAGARYLRRLARDADIARMEAAATAQELERDRHRRLLHDQATVLQLLARGEQDPDLESALRRQAAVGAAEIRYFMSGRPKECSDARDLASVVRSAAAPFTDLPLTLNVELAENAELESAVSVALSRAIATILHNVRVHADAQSVVVHADWVSDEWEVVVRDDGVGFDQEAVAMGFGLSEQVLCAMAEHGARVQIESAVGEGTTVTLGGPLPVSPHSPDRPDPRRAVVQGRRGSGPAGSQQTSD